MVQHRLGTCLIHPEDCPPWRTDMLSLEVANARVSEYTINIQADSPNFAFIRKILFEQSEMAGKYCSYLQHVVLTNGIVIKCK